MTDRTERGDTVAEQPTKTVDVTDVRRTTPVLFAALACMMAHTFRVVLKGKEPIALECVRCATTWTTQREQA